MIHRSSAQPQSPTIQQPHQQQQQQYHHQHSSSHSSHQQLASPQHPHHHHHLTHSSSMRLIENHTPTVEEEDSDDPRMMAASSSHMYHQARASPTAPHRSAPSASSTPAVDGDDNEGPHYHYVIKASSDHPSSTTSKVGGIPLKLERSKDFESSDEPPVHQHDDDDSTCNCQYGLPLIEDTLKVHPPYQPFGQQQTQAMQVEEDMEYIMDRPIPAVNLEATQEQLSMQQQRQQQRQTLTRGASLPGSNSATLTTAQMYALQQQQLQIQQQQQLQQIQQQVQQRQRTKTPSGIPNYGNGSPESRSMVHNGSTSGGIGIGHQYAHTSISNSPASMHGHSRRGSTSIHSTFALPSGVNPMIYHTAPMPLPSSTSAAVSAAAQAAHAAVIATATNTATSSGNSSINSTSKPPFSRSNSISLSGLNISADVSTAALLAATATLPVDVALPIVQATVYDESSEEYQQYKAAWLADKEAGAREALRQSQIDRAVAQGLIPKSHTRKHSRSMFGDSNHVSRATSPALVGSPFQRAASPTYGNYPNHHAGISPPSVMRTASPYGDYPRGASGSTATTTAATAVASAVSPYGSSGPSPVPSSPTPHDRRGHRGHSLSTCSPFIRSLSPMGSPNSPTIFATLVESNSRNVSRNISPAPQSPSQHYHQLQYANFTTREFSFPHPSGTPISSGRNISPLPPPHSVGHRHDRHLSVSHAPIYDIPSSTSHSHSQSHSQSQSPPSVTSPPIVNTHAEFPTPSASAHSSTSPPAVASSIATSTGNGNSSTIRLESFDQLKIGVTTPTSPNEPSTTPTR